MKRYLLVGVLALFSFSLTADIEVQVGPDAGYYDDSYDDGVYWTGPGYYYGFWFGTQGDFNNYRRNNYYNHGPRDGDGNRPDGDGGHRGGGGHR